MSPHPSQLGPFSDISPIEAIRLKIALNTHFTRALNSYLSKLPADHLPYLASLVSWRTWLRNELDYSIDRKDKFFGRFRRLTKQEMDIAVEQALCPVSEYAQRVVRAHEAGTRKRKREEGDVDGNEDEDGDGGEREEVTAGRLVIDFDFLVGKKEVQRRVERAQVLDEIGFTEFWAEDY